MTNIITKDKTLIIKGIAILFMIAHHCLIKEFYLQPSEFLYSFLSIHLQIVAKMCVGIFTFFVGFGCFYASKVDINYIINRVLKLLKQYWIILFITVLISIVFKLDFNNFQIFVSSGNFLHSCYIFFLNLFGFNSRYNLGNWYVYFYIYSLFLLPVIISAFKGRIYFKTIVLTIVFSVSSFLLPGGNYFLYAVKLCLSYTPVLIIGYVCAKTNVLMRIFNLIPKGYLWFIILFVILIVRSYTTNFKGFVTDIFIVPIFVLAISAIFLGKEDSIIARTLTSLGKNSTLMWFIHAIPLSDATRQVFQTNPFWTNNVLLLYLTLTIVSYIFAVICRKLFDKLRII